MSNEVTAKDNYYKLKVRVVGAMKTSTVCKDYIEYLKHRLQNERKQYEDEQATEFARGRVVMLRDLIEELEGK